MEDPKISGVYSPDGLVCGDYPLRDAPVTVASGAGALERGTVLGQVTASGKYVMHDNGATDGSETPRAILAEPVDATAADAAGAAYFSGTFDGDKLVMGGTATKDTVEAALRAQSAPMFIRSRVAG